MCRDLGHGGRRCNGGDRGNTLRRIGYASDCARWAVEHGQGRRFARYVKKVSGHRAHLREACGQDHLPDLLPPEQQVPAAKMLATVGHDGQFRRDGRPYLVHPEAVATRLEEAGFPPSVVAAGWLHDVPEDTDYTVDDLRSAGFDPHTVETVECVTHHAGESYLGASMPRAVTTLDSAALKDADNQHNTSDRLGPAPAGYAKHIARTEKYLEARRQIKARLYETPEGQAELAAQLAARDRASAPA